MKIEIELNADRLEEVKSLYCVITGENDSARQNEIYCVLQKVATKAAENALDVLYNKLYGESVQFERLVKTHREKTFSIIEEVESIGAAEEKREKKISHKA